MRVQLASEGAPGTVNEDRGFVAGSLVGVLDGVTVPPGLSSGCRHGPAWYVTRLAVRLAEVAATPGEPLTDCLAEAIQLVVHLRMDASGRRLVSSIYEVTGLEGDAIAGSELFALEGGALRWTGIRSRREARLLAAGYAGPGRSASP